MSEYILMRFTGSDTAEEKKWLAFLQKALAGIDRGIRVSPTAIEYDGGQEPQILKIIRDCGFAVTDGPLREDQLPLPGFRHPAEMSAS